VAGDGRENGGFGKSKFDAERTSEFGKLFKEEGESSIRESNGSVIHDRGGVRFRVKEIIVMLLVFEETGDRIESV
jgi:hypothetical protein